MDGTFKIVPELFFQLYTVHALGPGGFFVPCLYALLPNKSREMYNRLFNQMKTLRPNMMPRTIMIDFERATLQAVTDAFPTATVNGCFYHLQQNIIQKIQSEGLQVQYQTNRDVELQARMIAAIAFVTLANVENAFESLRTPPSTSWNQSSTISKIPISAVPDVVMVAVTLCSLIVCGTCMAEWKKTFHERTTTSRDGIEK